MPRKLAVQKVGYFSIFLIQVVAYTTPGQLSSYVKMVKGLMHTLFSQVVACLTIFTNGDVSQQIWLFSRVTFIWVTFACLLGERLSSTSLPSFSQESNSVQR